MGIVYQWEEVVCVNDTLWGGSDGDTDVFVVGHGSVEVEVEDVKAVAGGARHGEDAVDD